MLSSADLKQLMEDDGINNVGLDDIAGAPELSIGAEDAVERGDAQEASTGGEDGAAVALCDGAVENRYIRRSTERSPRLLDGHSIIYRVTEDEPVREAVLGGPKLPWALEVSARRMQVGDVVEVIARGEHAFADEEELEDGAERRWRFELVSFSGTPRDKFQLTADERMELANELRERGNEMLRRRRLLRAGDYYERGSALMDILESEDFGMPGKKDEAAVLRNLKIRECQKPILLNWSLVLIRLGRFAEAERKCSEVLADVDGGCVKALFRRGQCHTELGDLEQARKDLRLAQDLDPSISAEVEKEMLKLSRKQKALDAKDKDWAKRALQKGLRDDRSKAGGSASTTSDATTEVGPTEATVPAGSAAAHPLLAALKEQDRAAEADPDSQDHLTWCRQREALYNQFLQRPARDDD